MRGIRGIRSGSIVALFFLMVSVSLVPQAAAVRLFSGAIQAVFAPAF